MGGGEGNSGVLILIVMSIVFEEVDWCKLFIICIIRNFYI